MEKGTSLKPWVLFAIATGLLVAGWLMKLFPVFIFVALAPLLAITDHVRDEDHFWNLVELILISLAIGFVAARTFEMNEVVLTLAEAIAFSCAFLGYSFAHQNLGLGKFTIIFFWLGIEFVLLELPWRGETIFLGDALQLKEGWLGWTQHTGYAGTTLWILVVNLLAYHAYFKDGKINLIFVSLVILAIGGPVIASYSRVEQATSKMDMVAFYSKFTTNWQNYIGAREVIHPVAAGMSAFILVSSLLKHNMRKG